MLILLTHLIYRASTGIERHTVEAGLAGHKVGRALLHNERLYEWWLRGVKVVQMVVAGVKVVRMMVAGVKVV